MEPTAISPDMTNFEGNSAMLCDGEGPMMSANQSQFGVLRHTTTNYAQTKNSNDEAYANQCTEWLELWPHDGIKKDSENFPYDEFDFESILKDFEIPQPSPDIVALNTESAASICSTPHCLIELAPAAPTNEVPGIVVPPSVDYNATSTVLPVQVLMPQDPNSGVNPGNQEPPSNQENIIVSGDKTQNENFQYLICELSTNNDQVIGLCESTPDQASSSADPPVAFVPPVAVAPPTVSPTGIRYQLSRPIVPKDPNTREDSKSRRRGREKRTRKYELSPLEDPVAEKQRLNACNAKKNRERRKKEEEEMRQTLNDIIRERDRLKGELDMLKEENTSMEARLEAIQKILMGKK